QPAIRGRRPLPGRDRARHIAVRSAQRGRLERQAVGDGARRPYGAAGTLIARDPDADFNPLTNANRYVGLMLDRGYAVAHTLRSTQIGGGDVVVSREDGTTQKGNISSHGGFLKDFTAITQNVL